MASIVSKKLPTSLEAEKNGEDQEETDQKNTSLVTTHLYLKPVHSAGTVDKEVVLRRIRHRKRVNNVKKAVEALLISSPSSSKEDNKKVSVRQIIKWAGDAFAAP